RAFDAQIDVRYQLDPAVGLLVPIEMREKYHTGRERSTIEGKATYSKFRQFQVGGREIPAYQGEPEATLTRLENRHGRTSDMEGLSKDQPGEHSNQGLPGDRRWCHAQLQSAARRVSDAHSAEALVSEVRARG